MLSNEISIIKPLKEAKSYEVAGLANVQSDRSKPFEFQQFGFGFITDTLLIKPYDLVLSNFLRHELDDVEELKVGEVDAELRVKSDEVRYFDYAGHVLAIDTKAGYWPVRSRAKQGVYKKSDGKGYRKTGERLLSKCSLDVIEFQGHFVPKAVSYSGQDQVVSISIDWKSVNAKPEEPAISIEEFAADISKFVALQ